MGLTLLTPAAAWPVSLTEAKAQVRVDSDDSNTLLTFLIAAATRYIEQNLSRSLAEQTWVLTLDAFADAIDLPRGPVQSVTAFEYVDADAVTQDVDADAYTLDTTSHPPRIILNEGFSWPTPKDITNAVSITYVAGYDDLPDDLKHAILLLIGTWFRHRESVGDDKELPLAVDALLMNYRWVLA